MTELEKDRAYQFELIRRNLWVNTLTGKVVNHDPAFAVSTANLALEAYDAKFPPMGSVAHVSLSKP